MSSTINARTGKVLSVAGLDVPARSLKKAVEELERRMIVRFSRRHFLGAVPAARRLRRPIAALGGQRRIRLHGRPHRPADFPGALRSADAALHPVAVGLAYGSQPEWKRSVGFAAGHVRYLWAQGGVRQQLRRAGGAVQLAARESAPAAPRKNTLSDREAR